METNLTLTTTYQSWNLKLEDFDSEKRFARHGLEIGTKLKI
jgi:hypothetical protein